MQYCLKWSEFTDTCQAHNTDTIASFNRRPVYLVRPKGTPSKEQKPAGELEKQSNRKN